jgi:hypothetical protein
LKRDWVRAAEAGAVGLVDDVGGVSRALGARVPVGELKRRRSDVLRKEPVLLESGRAHIRSRENARLRQAR